MNIKLYTHNQIAYESTIEHWENHNNMAAIVHATGTGKSFIILRCLEDFDKYDNKIILVPSKYIREQILKHMSDVHLNQNNIHVMTYSKLSRLSDYDISLLEPSFIVLDEFHRCGAKKWGRGVKRLLDRYPHSRVLGTTATQIRFLDKKRDMADELFGGNVVSSISLTDAIVHKILPMPVYVSALYTFDEEIKKILDKIMRSRLSSKEKEEKINYVSILKNNLEKSGGASDILRKYMRGVSGKYIIFCKNIEHIREMQDTVVEWFSDATKSTISTHFVYHGYNKSNEDFEAFNGPLSTNEIKLLFSINMFNEGMHIRDISGVVLLRPTISPIVYFQQIGRAIDINNTSPLIFDFVNNLDSIGAKDFIREIDKSIDGIRNSHIDLDLSKKELLKQLVFSIYDETIDVNNMLRDVENRIFSNWDIMFARLKGFYSIHGHSDVPGIYEDQQLSNWVKNQRKRYIRKTIQNNQIQQLEEINFSWNALEDKWDIMFARLKGFYSIHGHSDVPRVYDVDQQLSNWVRSQRDRSLRKGDIYEDRIQKLESVNFSWNTLDDKWDIMYSKLERFYSIHGHSDVPGIYEDQQLSNWVKNQRTSYMNSKISEQRIQLLEKLNFSWNILEDKWDIMYSKLENYFKEHGNANVPSMYDEDQQLSTWVQNQRRNRLNSKISEQRIQLLDKLNFSWKIHNDKWDIMYSKLENYFKEHGNANVPTSTYKLDPSLGKWVGRQREKYKNGKLTEYQINKLRAINFRM